MLHPIVKYGFKFDRVIANANKRDKSFYFLVSRNKKKYILKIRNATGQTRPVFDLQVLTKYSRFGYPEVLRSWKIGNKLVVLASYHDGDVVSEMAYVPINANLHAGIRRFFEDYIDFLLISTATAPLSYEHVDSSIVLKKLDTYIPKLMSRYETISLSCVDRVKQSLLHNSSLYDNMMVIQHGDCYGCNMVVRGDGYITLIDWDSTKYASVFYDLGVFIAKHSLDDELIASLYEIAKSKCKTPSERRILDISIAFAILRQLKSIADLDDKLFNSDLFVTFSKSLLTTFQKYCPESTGGNDDE